MASENDLPFCDLVMKGGVTSGVVYPRMISRLAAHYRFKSIGGTSAGAIAAGAAAAAEYRRRVKGEMVGFDRLKTLPNELQTQSGSPPHSRLFHLFQPTPQLAKHFAVLVRMLNKSPGASAGHAVLAILRQFWVVALACLTISLLLLAPVVNWAVPETGRWPVALGALGVFVFWCLWMAFGLSRRSLRSDACGILPVVWWVSGLIGTGLILADAVAPISMMRTALPALVASVLSPLLVGVTAMFIWGRFAATLVQGLHANGYGMCSGRTVGDKETDLEGLTDWLSKYFNDLAGLGKDQPLTFGDLWGAQAEKAGSLRVGPADRQIDLVVMTTAISRQTGHSIPFVNPIPRYYDQSEWSRLFPDWVMAWIDKHSTTGMDEGDAAGRDRQRIVVAEGEPDRILRRLPDMELLPIVVAIRMSLSFPMLLSAIPLYEIDYSRKHNQRSKTVDGKWEEAAVLQATRVWYSDGGISSNLPLHFFDYLLPKHIAFAVNLTTEHPDHPLDPKKQAKEQSGRVYTFDGTFGDAVIRHWSAPNDTVPFGGLLEFLVGIVNTMQNWRDQIMYSYPGYRERMVHISLLGDEGGLNLDMGPKSVEDLGKIGEHAAELLIDRFHPAGPNQGVAWNNHLNGKFRTFLAEIRQMALDLRPRVRGGDLEAVVRDWASSRALSKPEIDFALLCIKNIAELGDFLENNGASHSSENFGMGRWVRLRINAEI